MFSVIHFICLSFLYWGLVDLLCPQLEQPRSQGFSDKRFVSDETCGVHHLGEVKKENFVLSIELID